MTQIQNNVFLNESVFNRILKTVGVQNHWPIRFGTAWSVKRFHKRTLNFDVLLHIKNTPNLTLFHVGGEVSSPPHQFLLNNFFCKNRIDLKLLDFLSYTYTHPIHLKNLKKIYYSSVGNHPKLTEIWFLGYKGYS